VSADVLLQSWQPGQDEGYGLDYDSLSRLNPRLVYCHLPVYGSHGPYAGFPADDTLAAALGGMLEGQWSYRPGPVYMVIPLISYGQAILASAAIGATLYWRSRSGRGERLEVSALDGCMALQAGSYLQGSGVMRLASGGIPPIGPFPTYRLYRASDAWLFIGALTPAFWTKLALALGLEEYLADPRFKSAPLAIEDAAAAAELAGRIAELIGQRTRDQWLQTLQEADVPCGPVLTREQFIEDTQVIHNGMRLDLDLPGIGPSVQMNVPLRFHDTPGAVRGPLRDIDEAQPVYEGMWLAGRRRTESGQAVAATTGSQAPLDGITVLDLSGFIAGANGGMLLADLGANVIKVEATDGDPWRGFGFGFLGANRGKRSLAVDLKRTEGRELLYAMVRRADVVLDNFRAGVTERLRIDDERLRQINPRLVCCSVTAFGSSGPLSHLPGFDPLLQARSGLMQAQGGAGGEPVYYQIAVNDYGSALMAAYGIVAALVARERTGRGQRVESCLTNNALAMQAGEFIWYEGRPPGESGGADLLGRGALYRAYRASDGWLFLAVKTEEQARRLLEWAGEAMLARGSSQALAEPLDSPLALNLERRFAEEHVQEICYTLLKIGVPCAPSTPVADLFADPHLNANGLWWDTVHPTWGPLRQTGATAHWRDLQMRLERPAPLLGQHSREVLREFVLDPAWIEHVIGSGVVAQAAALPEP
ncbi:MAG: CoA transferase, partial [Dehalococcoidia bacterium]